MKRLPFASAMLLAAGVCPPAVLAQTPSAPTASQIDTARQRVPAPLPALPQFDLRLQSPEKSPVTRAIDEIDFEVKSVRVVGATAYPTAELEALFDGLKNRRAKLSDLREIAEHIEDRYRADDYFLTRVFIPAQRVKDGTFEIRIIEGYIGAVYVDGGSESQRVRLESALAELSKVKPIPMGVLERALLKADEMPGVNASGLLRPGGALGESELLVTLTELPDSTSLGANNAASKASGPWSLSAYATFNNPLGFEGQLNLGSSFAPDASRSQSLFARYARTLGWPGTTAGIGVVASRSQPAGALAVLESKSTSTSINPRLRQTLLRTRQNSLYLDLALAINRASSKMLGQLQVDDRASVAEATVSWQAIDPGGSTQATLSYFQGAGLAGAMGRDARLPSVANFEPRFGKWVYAFNRIQLLPERSSVLLAMQTQKSSDILLSGEVAAFGGSYIGRGYDSAAIVGDSGTGALLEFRHDASFEWGNTTLTLQPYAFADTALAFSNSTLARQRLRSSGGGVRLNVGSSAAFDLMLARARIPLDTTDPKSNPRLVFNSLFRF